MATSRAALSNRSRQLNSQDVEYHRSHGLPPAAAQGAAQGARSEGARAPDQAPPADMATTEKR